MRRLHCTLTPGLVRVTAAQGLQQALAWKDFGKVKVTALINLVLLVAALRQTISAVVRRFRFGFSHETARNALDANLPPLDKLTQGLVDALHGWLPRSVTRKSWDIAIDLHYVPFYGAPKTPGVLGGLKKQGTNRFFVYATAVIVHRGQRWCLALAPVQSTHFEEAVEQLAKQLHERDIKVRCLILDRGFHSGHVMLALQKRQLPFVIGISRKKGFIEKLFSAPIGKVHQHQWKTERGGHPVAVSMIVASRKIKGQRRRRELYAFHGIAPERAVRSHQRANFYRTLNQRRFGIETSYRQMRQSQTKTTSCQQRQRLLWLGLALLLRQVWQWLQQKLTPRGTRWSYWRPNPALSLSTMLSWLAEAIRYLYAPLKRLELPQPMQLPAVKPHKA
jgi:putative transposase